MPNILLLKLGPLSKENIETIYDDESYWSLGVDLRKKIEKKMFAIFQPCTLKSAMK